MEAIVIVSALVIVYYLHGIRHALDWIAKSLDEKMPPKLK
jgi:hypothetical protein